MLTIASRVESLIERWPLLKQGMDLDLVNLSALARHIRPELEAEIGERVSDAAVMMALRRYQSKAREVSSQRRPQEFLGDMSVRSELADLTYTNSPRLERQVAKLSEHIGSQVYFTVSRGLLQTSVIVHESARGVVEKLFAQENLETSVLGLTAITLHLKPGHDQVAGILAYPLNLFAWHGITVIELVSTFDELNIVLYDKDVEAAFRILKQALR
ncbi:hypothetical protein KC957_03775 [Candidatus Saccharibacteria bacterium]|nr:hypothetical protein [Candidatus Saccharibacteria bacterium]